MQLNGIGNKKCFYFLYIKCHACQNLSGAHLRNSIAGAKVGDGFVFSLVGAPQVVANDFTRISAFCRMRRDRRRD